MNRRNFEINKEWFGTPKATRFRKIKLQVPENRFYAEVSKLLIPSKIFMAGGAVSSMLAPKGSVPRYSDFDLYVCDEKFFPLIENMLQNRGYKRKVESNWADTYKKNNQKPIQLIKALVGKPHQVLPYFDFSVVRCAWDGKTAWKDYAYDKDIKKKWLRLKHITCPISVMRRVVKYGKKGFFVSNYTLVKLFLNFMDKPTEWIDGVVRLTAKKEGGQRLEAEEFDLLERMLARID